METKIRPQITRAEDPRLQSSPSSTGPSKQILKQAPEHSSVVNQTRPDITAEQVDRLHATVLEQLRGGTPLEDAHGGGLNEDRVRALLSDD